MMRDILLVDKDETIGSMQDLQFFFFDGAEEFIQYQHRNKKEIYIATDAGTHAARQQLDGINSYLTGILGYDDIAKRAPDWTNPYCNPPGKDIALARHRIDPANPDALRTVMIADPGDAKFVAPSDPLTPMLIFNMYADHTLQYHAIGHATNILFQRKEQPWKIYDEIWSNARGREEQRTIHLDNIPFTLRRSGEIGPARIIQPNTTPYSPL